MNEDEICKKCKHNRNMHGTNAINKKKICADTLDGTYRTPCKCTGYEGFKEEKK